MNIKMTTVNIGSVQNDVISRIMIPMGSTVGCPEIRLLNVVSEFPRSLRHDMKTIIKFNI